MLINMIDGYDVFIMGYANPHLPDGYATTAEKGYLISAALAGLGVGAIFLARLADKYGRRPLLVGALACNSVGVLISALAPNYSVLIASRFFTGMAVGVLGVLTTIVGQEMSPPSRRSLSIGIVLFGYPLGGFLAGLTGAFVIDAAGGWRGLFFVGAALSVAMFAVCVISVPETVPYLRKSSSDRSRHAANALASRLNLEEGETPTPARVIVGDIDEDARLLGKSYRRVTLLLWTGYAVLSAAYYFVGTWTPQLIKDATGDAGSGAVVGMVISIGTMTGAVIYGFLGLRVSSAKISWVAALVAMIALVAFALSLQGAAALTFALLLGAAIFTSMAAFTALANQVYPVLLRAKGYGAMVGVARIGAILAPIFAGYAASFMTTRNLYLTVLVPLAFALVCSLGLLGVAWARSVSGVTEPRDSVVKS